LKTIHVPYMYLYLDLGETPRPERATISIYLELYYITILPSYSNNNPLINDELSARTSTDKQLIHMPRLLLLLCILAPLRYCIQTVVCSVSQYGQTEGTAGRCVTRKKPERFSVWRAAKISAPLWIVPQIYTCTVHTLPY